MQVLTFPRLAGLPLRVFQLVVVSINLFALIIAAAGTARFSDGLGFGQVPGWVLGAIFELAKEVLPLVVLTLWLRQRQPLALVLLVPWLGLLIYSAFATHATVSSVIAEGERKGTRTMESRTGTQAELASIDQQIARLSEPKVPRSAKMVREVLAAEKVPAGVWRDSQECFSIRGSTYFQKACAGLLELRQELAAAEEYERLNHTARALRKILAETPIVATSDPLSEAFNKTLHLVLSIDDRNPLPIEGRSVAAFLLTLVTEFMSIVGFTVLKLVRDETAPEEGGRASRSPKRRRELALQPSKDSSGPPRHDRDKGADSSAREGTPTRSQCGISCPARSSVGRADHVVATETGDRAGFPPAPESPLAHVRVFLDSRVERADGGWIAASDLQASYKTWRKASGHRPLSPQKFSAEVQRLGVKKGRSSSIRYRNLQFRTAPREGLRLAG